MGRTRKLTRLAGGLSLWVPALIAIALTLLFVATRSDRHNRNSGAQLQPLDVLVGRVRWEPDYTAARSFVGQVEAKQASDVGFELPGTIASIAVTEGDAVDAGAMLAALDPARLQAQQAERIAAVAQARADLELAEVTDTRTAEAVRVEAVSVQKADDAAKAHQAARAKLRQAEAALAAVEVDLAKSVIRSPFDAIVAVRHVDVGRVVEAGRPVIRLLQRTDPELRIGLAGKAVAAIEIGQPFDVTINGRPYPAVVSAILPVRDRTDRAIDVIFTLGVELGAVREGDLARIVIGRRVTERGFWVPTRAMTAGTRGLWVLYAIDKRSAAPGEGRLMRVTVEVIATEGERTLVRGPINEGALFMTEGLHRVAPGMRVRYAPPTDRTSRSEP